MAAEDELRLDRPVAHLRGLFLRPRVRNSLSACATTAEIVRPDSRACSRTARREPGRYLDREHHAWPPGTGTRPDAAAWSTYRRACRGEHPNRPASTRAASAAGTPPSSQLRSRVDPLSMLAAVSAAMTRHAINILPDMSLVAGDTPRPFQPPVAQRDLEAEVIYCVGGVISALCC